MMDSWIVAGLLAVTSVTTTMGALGIVVEDRAKKINKDFIASPIRTGSITLGYLMAAYLVGVIMTLVALALGQGYILPNGGQWLLWEDYLKVFVLILLSTFASNALIGFLVTFFNSQSAFVSASTVLGTLIGFITGIYLPIGTLPEAVQYVVKCFPISHAGALFRQVLMSREIDAAFSGAPAQYVLEFEELMGVTYRFGDYTVTPWVSCLILAGTGVLFSILAVAGMSRKRR